MTYTWAGNVNDLNGEPSGLYACNGCGALLLDEDKITHDKFHFALAEMFEAWVR